MSISEEQEKLMVSNIIGNKPSKDVAQSDDTFVVLPLGELSAIMDALYYTLEHTTSETFGIDIKKNMLAALKRLE